VHVPDGFLDAPTSLATGAVAVAAVTVALRRARADLDERAAPLAGLTAAFVFAVQMINFPVGVGTSGHLLGGALAAVLVGPWTAVLVMTVVLLVQALLFADGGLTALGTNSTLLGVVTVLVGWATVRVVLGVLPRRPASVVPAAFAGALVSVPAAAFCFVLLYAVGGAVALPFATLAATMVGWHLLIGLGEAFVTAATVSAVVAVRPDLVHAARGLRQQLVLRRPDGTVVPAPTSEVAAGPRRPYGRFAVVAGAVALLLAGVASFFASPDPDGLNRVAADRGFLATARDHLLGANPLAGYGDVGGIPVGVAGVLGVLVTVGLGFALVRLAARRRDVSPHPEHDDTRAGV
jgi:cobalt/nickel transport system permease protein